MAFGYYAEGAGNVIEVFDTSGTVADELMVKPIPGRETRLALVFWVDEEQFEATLARVDRWRGKGRYKLFERDCVTFLADIIEPLGLRIPSRILLPTPHQFVVALLEGNARRQRS